MTIDFTAVAIAALSGIIMTLFFAYFPKVRVWFATMEIDKQSLIKLGFMVVIEGTLAGLSFIPGVLFLKPPFTWADALTVAFALIITNKPLDSALPMLRDVRIAIQKRMKKFSS